MSGQNRRALVSVIVPCYKQAHFLPEALVSVQAQTYSEWECIIVDDGSPDDTGEVARELAAGDDRIRCVSQENRGLGGARNAGLARSAGAFVQFLDADDRIEPEKFETELRLFAEHPDATVVYSGYRCFDEQGPKEPNQPLRCGPMNDPLETITSRWAREFNIPIHAGMFARERVFEPPWFDETVRGCEDWIFWTRLAVGGAVFVHHPEPHALYRQHPQSMTQDRLFMATQTCRAVEVASRLRPVNGREGDFRRLLCERRLFYRHWAFDSVLAEKGILAAVTKIHYAFSSSAEALSARRWAHVLKQAARRMRRS